MAMRSGPEGSAGVVHCVPADHLASSAVITDGASAVVGARR
jgi:hypothetical protein